MRYVVVIWAGLLGLLVPGLAAGMSDSQRIKMLEDAMRRQQEEIRELRQELQQQRAVGQATQKQAEQADQKVSTIEKNHPAAPPKWLDKISMFGDGRVRVEGFYNQPQKNNATSPTTARTRERLRFRPGITYRYSDEIAATVRLASGDPNDPISSNQSFTNQFTKKPISLDWAYLTFSPGKSFGIRPGLFTLVGGKFGQQQFRVGEMLFDEDLSPEGFSEEFQFLDKPVGPLDQLRLWVQQWQFNEIANAQDGWIFGGQVNPVGHFGPLQLEGGVAQWWYLNPNQIAMALNTNSSLANTNAVIKQEVNGKKQIVAYQSGFNLTDSSLAATLPDVIETMPLRFFLEYVHNWQAVNGRDNATQVGMRLGQTRVRGDWSVTGLFESIDQEAALSAFTWSDFGPGGTNERGGMFELAYQVLDPLTLSARTFFTNYIDKPFNMNNPTLLRLQIDALVRW
jgi:hypothetical protein